MNKIKMNYVQDYLFHHGIAGQKWGERHGPPYPLDRIKNLAKRAYRGTKKGVTEAAKNTVKGVNKVSTKINDKVKESDERKQQYAKQLNDYRKAVEKHFDETDYNYDEGFMGSIKSKNSLGETVKLSIQSHVMDDAYQYPKKLANESITPEKHAKVISNIPKHFLNADKQLREHIAKHGEKIRPNSAKNPLIEVGYDGTGSLSYNIGLLAERKVHVDWNSGKILGFNLTGIGVPPYPYGQRWGVPSKKR